MGDVQMSGGTAAGGALRKRNWDRNGCAEQHSPQHICESGYVSAPSINNYLHYRGGDTVDQNNLSRQPPLSAPPPPNDAKDLSFWTNVFFSNANEAPTALPPTPHKDRHQQNQQRKSSGAVAVGLLNESPTATTDLSTASVSVPTTSSSLFSYLYGGGGGATSLSSSSSSTSQPTAAFFDNNSGRYAAIQSGIKRKNHLSKTTKNSGEATERTTDLFLLPSCSGGPIYSSLGMTDVSPCTDGSRFIQVSFCLFFHLFPFQIYRFIFWLKIVYNYILIKWYHICRYTNLNTSRL